MTSLEFWVFYIRTAIVGAVLVGFTGNEVADYVTDFVDVCTSVMCSRNFNNRSVIVISDRTF